MVSHRNNHNNFLTIIFGIITGIIIISGCSPYEGKTIQFETIENQDTRRTGEDYPGKDIHLVVITSKNEVGDLASWVSQEAESELEKLDYSSFFALAIFQGIKPTNRYGIEITKITQEGNKINLEARIQTRDPKLEAADVQTSPYHLISIAKTGQWNEDFNFYVIQSGNLITSTNHFIP